MPQLRRKRRWQRSQGRPTRERQAARVAMPTTRLPEPASKDRYGYLQRLDLLLGCLQVRDDSLPTVPGRSLLCSSWRRCSPCWDRPVLGRRARTISSRTSHTGQQPADPAEPPPTRPGTSKVTRSYCHVSSGLPLFSNIKTGIRIHHYETFHRREPTSYSMQPGSYCLHPSPLTSIRIRSRTSALSSISIALLPSVIPVTLGRVAFGPCSLPCTSFAQRTHSGRTALRPRVRALRAASPCPGPPAACTVTCVDGLIG